MTTKKKITENFSVKEMTASDTATKEKIANVPSAEILEALTFLCEQVLEPVRAHFGKPVKVSSGFRSDKLNSRIGGATNSLHTKGQAVDFEIEGIDNKELAEWVKNNCKYDQIILEYYVDNNGKPSNDGWVHVSVRKVESNRKELLTATKDGKRTKYTPVKSFK